MLPAFEQVGFDSYWAPDHIDIPLSDLAVDPDAFCYGARVGTMTNLPYGISVTDATRRGRPCPQYGDGWIPAWSMSPEEYGEKLQVIAGHASAPGRGRAAPTIPFEMVQQVLFIGNSEELAGQFEAYARAGLEHVVLANITGVVGGMTDVEGDPLGTVSLIG